MALQDLGNYNFGVLAKSAGYPRQFAQLGAGLYQIYSNTSRLDWVLLSMWPTFPASITYGDDPRDARYIRDGYKHKF